MSYYNKILHIVIFFVFISTCFNYQDSIYLNEDLSGKINIQYSIPLKKLGNNKYKSLITKLPYLDEKINQVYTDDEFNIVKMKKKVYTRDEYEKINPVKSTNSDFKKLKNKINYYGNVDLQILFKNWQDLQKIIPGKITIKKTENGFHFQRRIKGGKLKKRYESSGEKKIHKYSKDFFRGKTFQLNFSSPKGYKITKNNCHKLDDNICNWIFPLEEMLYKFSRQELFLFIEKKK
jgi:hypothetical protein